MPEYQHFIPKRICSCTLPSFDEVPEEQNETIAEKRKEFAPVPPIILNQTYILCCSMDGYVCTFTITEDVEEDAATCHRCSCVAYTKLPFGVDAIIATSFVEDKNKTILGKLFLLSSLGTIYVVEISEEQGKISLQRKSSWDTGECGATCLAIQTYDDESIEVTIGYDSGIIQCYPYKTPQRRSLPLWKGRLDSPIHSLASLSISNESYLCVGTKVWDHDDADMATVELMSVSAIARAYRKEVLDLSRFCIWPYPGMEIFFPRQNKSSSKQKNRRRHGFDDEEFGMGSSWISSMKIPMDTQSNNSACFAVVTSKGFVAICQAASDTADTTMLNWGVDRRHSTHQTQLPYTGSFIGMGVLDAASSNANRYLACCLAAGTVILVPICDRNITDDSVPCPCAKEHTIIFHYEEIYQYRSNELQEGEEVNDEALHLIQGFTAGYLSVGGEDVDNLPVSSEIQLHGLELCDSESRLDSHAAPKDVESQIQSVSSDSDLTDSDMPKRIMSNKMSNITEEEEGGEERSVSSLNQFQEKQLPQPLQNHQEISNDRTKSNSNKIIPVLVYTTNGYIMDIFSCEGMLLSSNDFENENDWLLRLLLNNGTIQTVVQFLHSTGEDDIQHTTKKLFPSEASSTLWMDAWRECQGVGYDAIVNGLIQVGDMFSSLRLLLLAVASGTFE